MENDLKKKGNEIADIVEKMVSWIVAAIVWGGIGVGLCLFMSSCKSTAPVVVPGGGHNYKEVEERWHYDSIYVHDSVWVEMWACGDTVYQTKEVTKTVYKEKVVHDSICIERTDTIVQVIEMPVEVEVPAALTKWEDTALCLGEVVLWILAFVLVGLLVWVASKLRIWKWFG